MEASRFWEIRHCCGLSVAATAKLLRVTERTVLHWESGKYRVPYAAYKLLRCLRGGQLPHPAWRGWVLRGEVLYTPEGLALRPVDGVWWSLLVRQAHQWRTEAWRLRVQAEQAKAAGGEAAPPWACLYTRQVISDGGVVGERVPLLPLLPPSGLPAMLAGRLP